MGCLPQCTQLQQTACLASTPLPALSGFTFSHSQGIKLGGYSPPHLMWEIATQGKGVLNHQVLHTSCALHSKALCRMVLPLVCVPWAIF